jgi:hypothetical protein
MVFREVMGLREIEIKKGRAAMRQLALLSNVRLVASLNGVAVSSGERIGASVALILLH